jgi:hypothetical protein
VSVLDRPAHWDTWLKRLVDKSAINSIVFLQLGAGHLATVGLLRDVGFHLAAVSEYLDSTTPDETRLVLTGIEELATAPGDQRLGDLRQRIQKDAKAGVRFVLHSTAPRVAFPILGSQILMDATFQTGPEPDLWADKAPDGVVFERQLDLSVTLREALPQVLSELGLSLCAQIDRAVFEAPQSGNAGLGLDSSEAEALRGAGLLSSDGDWLLGNHREDLRRALTDVLDSFDRAPSHVSETHVNVAALASRVRRTIRAAARARWGVNWTDELLPADRAQEVIERASRSIAPAATSIRHVRDPLAWLSLRELFALRVTAGLGNLGVSSGLWESAEQEVSAVEDRLRYLAHLTQRDAATVLKWNGVFAQRLSHTNHLHSANGIAESHTESEILNRLRDGLAPNRAFSADPGASFFALVTTTLRFLRLCADAKGSYTRPVTKEDVPLEKELQNHYYWYLGSVGLGDFAYQEVPNIATGRIDVLVLGERGVRFVTEVKREQRKSSLAELADSYFGQATDYQNNNAPLGQLLVLDLSDHSHGIPGVSDSVGVVSRTVGGQLRSVVIYVVRGNRPPPSAVH